MSNCNHEGSIIECLIPIGLLLWISAAILLFPIALSLELHSKWWLLTYAISIPLEVGWCILFQKL